MLNRRVYVGRCTECGCSLFYNEKEEKLVAKGGDPDCLHHYDWPGEDRKEEKKDENSS